MPSYTGIVLSPRDAIILLEASRQSSDNENVVPRIYRRLTEKERSELIKNGSVFVWEEKESGMRRWTDGKSWSASRVSNSFLVYKEMEPQSSSDRRIHSADDEFYSYKNDGLTKLSFSATLTTGQKMHLISYVATRLLLPGSDAIKGVPEEGLPRPCHDPKFRNLQADVSLYSENVVRNCDETILGTFNLFPHGMSPSPSAESPRVNPMYNPNMAPHPMARPPHIYQLGHSNVADQHHYVPRVQQPVIAHRQLPPLKSLARPDGPVPPPTDPSSNFYITNKVHDNQLLKALDRNFG